MEHEGQIAESLRYVGDRGDLVEAYCARPISAGPVPGVVVIHHNPGWDEATKEIARRFAHHGYAAISPHLFTREGKGTASPEDASAAARAAGGVPDERMLGDIAAAVELLRAQPYANGKVGIIGYCSGGRQAYLVGCSLDVDAVVDCYGGSVAPNDQPNPARPPVIGRTPEMGCPILLLFGEDDRNPSPEHRVKIEAALKEASKDFEMHSYEGAGHGFFGVDAPAYRVEAANDGWQRIFTFFGQHLGGN